MTMAVDHWVACAMGNQHTIWRTVLSTSRSECLRCPAPAGTESDKMRRKTFFVADIGWVRFAVLHRSYGFIAMRLFWNVFWSLC
jgi:hypothetical protein